MLFKRRKLNSDSSTTHAVYLIKPVFSQPRFLYYRKKQIQGSLNSFRIKVFIFFLSHITDKQANAGTYRYSKRLLDSRTLSKTVLSLQNVKVLESDYAFTYN